MGANLSSGIGPDFREPRHLDEDNRQRRLKRASAQSGGMDGANLRRSRPTKRRLLPCGKSFFGNEVPPHFPNKTNMLFAPSGIWHLENRLLYSPIASRVL